MKFVTAAGFLTLGIGTVYGGVGSRLFDDDLKKQYLEEKEDVQRYNVLKDKVRLDYDINNSGSKYEINEDVNKLVRDEIKFEKTKEQLNDVKAQEEMTDPWEELLFPGYQEAFEALEISDDKDEVLDIKEKIDYEYLEKPLTEEEAKEFVEQLFMVMMEALVAPVVELDNWENIEVEAIEALLIEMAQKMENETIGDDNIVENEEIKEKDIYDKYGNKIEKDVEIKTDYVDGAGDEVEETIKKRTFYKTFDPWQKSNVDFTQDDMFAGAYGGREFVNERDVSRWNDALIKGTNQTRYGEKTLIALGEPKYIRKQVVAGMNYEYTFADGTKVTVSEQLPVYGGSLAITEVTLPEY